VESLLGLIPGLGDVLGGLLAVYGLLVAVRVGVPRAVLLQMFFNIGLDTVTGAVPLVGDLFDFAWKANSRNLALLVRYLESPTETQAASRRWLVALLALLVVLCGLAFWLATMSMRALLYWFS
jgi:hypothetical protein